LRDDAGTAATTALVETEATKPAAWIAPFDVKEIVSAPPIEEMGMAGKATRLNIIGELVDAPLYTLRKSEPVSMANALKRRVIGPLAVMVHTQFAFGG
jgi:hypothetical protein